MTMDNTLVASVLLSAMAVVNVSLWTLRVTFAARGLRLPASTVAALEALLFTIAFSHVSNHLDSPARVGAYALGVAAGTYVGMLVDHRLSLAPADDRQPSTTPDGLPASSSPGSGCVPPRAARRRASQSSVRE